jgi:uncharacterized SAM-binding protein YcdF (DUF218 family)
MPSPNHAHSASTLRVMVSTAKLQQQVDTPLQGAFLALVIAGALVMLGIPAALNFGRPLALPIAMVAGAILARWFRRSMTVAAIALIVVVAIGTWSPIVPRLARPFVRNDAVNLQGVDAVFVFSNGTNSRGLVNSEGVDRLLTGIALRARRPELPLAISIVHFDERDNGVSSEADQRALIAMSPASASLITFDSVASTRDEAVRLSRHAFQQRWKRVLLITSPMHSRRACATVEALGLAVTCAVAPWRVASWPPRTARDRIVLMQRLVYETMAWAQYRVTGWAKWG